MTHLLFSLACGVCADPRLEQPFLRRNTLGDVEFSPQQRRCVRGQVAPAELVVDDPEHRVFTIVENQLGRLEFVQTFEFLQNLVSVVAVHKNPLPLVIPDNQRGEEPSAFDVLPQHLPLGFRERWAVGAEFFVNGEGVAGGWKYGHDADGTMSTPSIRT